MIEVANLEKYYGDKYALRKISFEVKPGEILGFLGPNGAGKSTTIKILTGLIPASGGQARLAGHDIAEEPLKVKSLLGYVPESGALYESLTAWEFLELVADLHMLERSLFERRANEFLDLFNLQSERHNRIAGFSKGMRQKLLISASLLHNPPVLLFDEALNGVDANTAMVFKQIIRRLSKQGKTIFFCSHILEVVERLCTRIVIIQDGSIVADGVPAEIAAKVGKATLEDAFAELTGGNNADSRADEFMTALEGLQK